MRRRVVYTSVSHSLHNWLLGTRRVGLSLILKYLKILDCDFLALRTGSHQQTLSVSRADSSHINCDMRIRHGYFLLM
jgi:hypothetical protein